MCLISLSNRTHLPTECPRERSMCQALKAPKFIRNKIVYYIFCWRQTEFKNILKQLHNKCKVIVLLLQFFFHKKFVYLCNWVSKHVKYRSITRIKRAQKGQAMIWSWSRVGLVDKNSIISCV